MHKHIPAFFGPLLVIFVMSWSHGGTETVQDSIGTVKKEGVVYTQYLVSPGETIYAISTAYNVSISKLMEINPDLENGLRAGQVLDIPYSSEVAAKQASARKANEDGQKVHTVKPGETLYSLSRKYGFTVSEFLTWNGNNVKLKAGQELIVSEEDAVKTEPSVESTSEDENTEVVVVESTPVESTVESTPKGTPADALRSSKDPLDEEISHDTQGEEYEVYHFDSTLKQVLIVPFDPHLYFSDADDEISKESSIPRVKVREIFRRRLNVLLAPPGYESIHLLGGRFSDTLSDLNKIYGSVTYNYHEVLYSEKYEERVTAEEKPAEDVKLKDWVKKQKDKIATPTQDEQAHTDKFHGKYFGVRIKDPSFFTYFKQKYSIDYYIFINQFEVKTDYEHCLDRSAHNYARDFTAHFSIFDINGNQIAGNKFKVHYDNSSNDVYKITADNMVKIAQRVLLELPKPNESY